MELGKSLVGEPNADLIDAPAFRLRYYQQTITWIVTGDLLQKRLRWPPGALDNNNNIMTLLWKNANRRASQVIINIFEVGIFGSEVFPFLQQEDKSRVDYDTALFVSFSGEVAS